MREKHEIPLTEVFSGSTRIGRKVGANAAIVHAKIAYYVNENKKAGRNFVNGKYWTYLTYEEISRYTGFITTKAVRNAVAKLREANLIEVGNFNSLAGDHTNWYTIPEEWMKLAYPHLK